MMDFSFRRVTTFFALGVLLALPACDRDDHDDHVDMHALEVIDLGMSEPSPVATWELDTGWVGALPVQDLSEQEWLSLGLVAYDDHGDEITLTESGEFYITYSVPEDPDQVIDTDRPNSELYHGDHVYVYGQAPGTAQIVFELRHVGHVERATHPITYTVTDSGVN